MKKIFFISITLFLATSIGAENNKENQESSDIFKKFSDSVVSGNYKDLDQNWLIQNKEILLKEINKKFKSVDKLEYLSNREFSKKYTPFHKNKFEEDLFIQLLSYGAVTTLSSTIRIITDSRRSGLVTFLVGLTLISIGINGLKKVKNLEQIMGLKNHAKIDTSGIVGQIKFAQKNKAILNIMSQFLKKLPDNGESPNQEGVKVS